MAIKRATGKTKLAIQPTVAEPATVSIGSLPTVDEIRPAVPDVSTQGDSYFSRESIGSAKFDSRMDFPSAKSSGFELQKCKGSQASSMSLSPERPTAIASIDLLSSAYGDPSATSLAIGETLEIADFESKLMQEDYTYIMDSLESSESTKADYASLKESATSALSKIETSVEAIQRVSAASVNFSRKLDIRLSWSDVQAKIAANYSSLTLRFGNDTPQSSLDSLRVNQKKDTSTAIVKKLERLVNAKEELEPERDSNGAPTATGIQLAAGSLAYESVIKRIAENDLLFDDGQIESYSKLEKLRKVAVCCEVISKIMNDTFMGALGSADISMPTFYSGSNCNVFDPFNITAGSNKTNSHYELISRTTESLDTATVEDFKSTFVASYRSTYESAKVKSALGYPEEVCTPLDIYTRIFKKTSESFQTVNDAAQSGLIANQAEIYDAVILAYSMKQQSSAKQFNGFMRGLILTNMLDEDFLLGYDSSGEYDTVTETKAEINDSAEGSKTVISKVATKTLQTKTLEEGGDIYNSVFSSTDRVYNFPDSSRAYTAAILGRMDECTASKELPWYAPLYHNFTPYKDGTDMVGYSSSKANRAVDSWSRNAPKAGSIVLENYVPSGETSYYDAPIGGVPVLVESLVESLQNFSRDKTGKTISNAIVETYDELIATFEKATGKSFSEVSPDGKFNAGDGTCTKRAMLDILVECYGNITNQFFKPGFIAVSAAKVSVADASSYSTAEDTLELLT